MVGQFYGNASARQRHRTAGAASHAVKSAVRALGVACTPLAIACALLTAACDRSPAAPPGDSPANSPTARAVDAAIQSAEAYLAAQKPREAAQVAARLAEQAPQLMRAQELHARALVALAFDPTSTPDDRARFIAEAADAYDRAAQLEPKMAALRHAAGVVNNTAKRPGAALAHYRAAHEAEPDNAQYALYLGVSLASAGETEAARALLLEAERKSPSSPDPKAALADLAVRTKDYGAARAAISQARALDPESLGLRVADARIRRLDKHPEQALDLLLALDPPVRLQPGIAEEIALAHSATGDYSSAANVLENSAHAALEDWRRAIRCAHAWQRAGQPPMPPHKGAGPWPPCCWQALC